MSKYSFHSIISETKRSLRLSLPLIASQLAYGASGFIATVMIAHSGRDELATHALVWGTFITLILFFIGILNAVSVLVSQSFGAKDDLGVQHATFQGLILGVLFAIPMMLIVWIAPFILIWTGQSAAIIKLATPYFHALGWCMLPLNILIVMEQFLIGITRSRIVLWISLIEVPLEIISFYVFIFGKFGFPKLGLAGIGYGMAVATTTLVLLIWFFSRFFNDRAKYGLYLKQLKFNRKYLLELVRVGSPMGFAYCIEVSLFTVIVFMMARLGEDILAAHQIAIQCVSLTMMITFGISIGASVRVGNEVGENNKDALKLAAYVNLGLGFCMMLVLSAIYIGFPKAIIALDVDVYAKKYQALVNHAMAFLSIAAILQIIDCFRIIGVSILRGLKDTKFPMYISFVAFWLIAFPCAYILGFTLHLGGVGVWWGLVIGFTVAVAILLIRFQYLVKRIDLAALVTR
jgi:MATE family multidrug resistance protein